MNVNEFKKWVLGDVESRCKTAREITERACIHYPPSGESDICGKCLKATEYYLKEKYKVGAGTF